MGCLGNRFSPVAIAWSRMDHACGVLVGVLSLASLAHGCAVGVGQVRDQPSLATMESTGTEATSGVDGGRVPRTPLGNLIAQLGNGDARAQLAALQELGEMGSSARPALPAVIGVLTTDDQTVAWEAAITLERIDPGEPVGSLARLVDVDPGVRRAAVSALAAQKRGDRIPGPLLLRLVANADIGTSELRLLSGSLDADGVAAIRTGLTNPKASVRAASARALGALGGKAHDAVPGLIAALDDSDGSVRKATASALASLGEEAAGAVPALIRASARRELSMGELSESLRKMIVTAIPALLGGLQDNDASVRATAAEGLGLLGGKAAEATPALIAAAQDRDALVRAAAITALGRLSGSAHDVVPSLIAALQDSVVPVRRAAALALLGALGGKSHGAVPALIAALDDRDPVIRRAAAQALASLGAEAVGAAPALIRATAHRELSMGELSGSLRKMNVTAMPALLGGLRDIEASVRATAAEVLGLLGGKAAEAAPALIAAAQDREASVRAASVTALGRLGVRTRDVVPSVIAALQDGQGSVRAAAVSALGSLGERARDAVPEIIAVLETAEPQSELAMAAANALERIDPSLVDALRRTIAMAASDADRSRAERAAFLLDRIDRAREQAQRQAQAQRQERLRRPGVEHPGGVEASRVEVYFATDRNLAGGSSPGEFYGIARGDLTFGIAEVSVPPTHRRADFEVPSLWKFEVRADPLKHMVLRSVEPLDKVRFLTRMNSDLRKLPSGKKSITIFIHGYRVSFEDAALRAAQIAYDLGQGVAGLFTWPSKGRLASYSSDEAAVVWATPHLKQFIGMLQRETQAEEINVIAHSMGSRALAEALHDLALEGSPAAPGRLGNVVFAAPDVDRGEFLNLQDRIKRMAKRITLYASSSDRALAVSSALHEYPRAGQAGADILVAEGIDTIDATAMNTDLLNHSYYSDNRSVIDDLFYLVTRGLTPDLRAGLRQRPLRGLYYWLFQP